jgi:hypothetical protein
MAFSWSENKGVLSERFQCGDGGFGRPAQVSQGPGRLPPDAGVAVPEAGKIGLQQLVFKGLDAREHFRARIGTVQLHGGTLARLARGR